MVYRHSWGITKAKTQDRGRRSSLCGYTSRSMRITHSRMMLIFQMMESTQLSMGERTHTHTETHRSWIASQTDSGELISERTECVPF